MAHECFACGSECYCNGDIDDCVVSLTPARCESCGCEDERYEDRDDDDYIDDEVEERYLARCPDCGTGTFEQQVLVCNVCGYVADPGDD